MSYGHAHRLVAVTAETPEERYSRMLRRHLLALGGFAVFGAPLIGELAGPLAHPDTLALPRRLSPVHVEQVHDLTGDLRAALLTRGSAPELSGAAAGWAERLLDVPGPDPLMRELRTAVAGLHTLAAGWAGLDAGLHDHALYHYSRGLELATDVGDSRLQAIALGCSGLVMLEQGHPCEALKMFQLARIRSWHIPLEYDRAMVESCAQADSAIALLGLDQTRTAATELAKSRDRWQPTRTDPRGDHDYVAARLEIGCGRLDTAEPFAAASIARWEGVSELHRTQSAVVLATIHVRTEEPGGLAMARRAILDVTKLSSVQARARLRPLVVALEARSDSDAQELARMACHVATTRV